MPGTNHKALSDVRVHVSCLPNLGSFWIAEGAQRRAEPGPTGLSDAGEADQKPVDRSYQRHPQMRRR